MWAQPSIKHSFFKNPDGEIHVLSPWRLVDYWTWTRAPDLDRLRPGLTGAGAAAGRRQSSAVSAP